MSDRNDSDKEKYLVERREAILRAEGEYVTHDERVRFKLVRRVVLLKLAADPTEERNLVQRQCRRNFGRVGALLAAIVVALATFVYALVPNLVAGWIQESCKLALSDLRSPTYFIAQFKEKCLH